MRAISSVTCTHSSRVGVRTRACTCGRRVDLLDDRDAEGGGLAGAGLRLADEVLAGAQAADGAGLHLGRGGEAHLLDGPGDGRRQLDVAEAMGRCAARTAAIEGGGIRMSSTGGCRWVLAWAPVPLAAARGASVSVSGKCGLTRSWWDSEGGSGPRSYHGGAQLDDRGPGSAYLRSDPGAD